MAFVVRDRWDPSALAPEVRAAVAAFDPRLPIFDVRPMPDVRRVGAIGAPIHDAAGGGVRRCRRCS